MTKLTGTSSVKWLGNYTIRAPGIEGEIKYAPRVSGGDRQGGAGIRTRDFSTLGLNDESVSVTTLELTIERNRPAAGSGDRSSASILTDSGDPAFEFGVPKVEDEEFSAILYTDLDSGYHHWVVPQPDAQATTNKTIFHIPIDPEQEKGDGDRGPKTKILRRLIQEFRGKLGKVAGFITKKALEFFASKKYGLYSIHGEELNDNIQWDKLATGRTLFFIHGTFSNIIDTYKHFFSSEEYKQLVEEYDAVIAFNHPTLHHSPTENIEWLANQIQGRKINSVDIITHSRGGLVAREFVRQITDPASAYSSDDDDKRTNRVLEQLKNIHVERVLFVASPHRGTILVDEENWNKLVDRYTNFLTDLPDSAFMLVVEGVLIVLRVAANAAFNQLPGLNSMLRGGDYLKGLNQFETPENVKYFSIASNFEPKRDDKLYKWYFRAVEKVVDGIFTEANDGVVPLKGSYDIDKKLTGFPNDIDEKWIKQSFTNIHHCNYFRNPIVQQEILRILANNT